MMQTLGMVWYFPTLVCKKDFRNVKLFWTNLPVAGMAHFSCDFLRATIPCVDSCCLFTINMTSLTGEEKKTGADPGLQLGVTKN